MASPYEFHYARSHDFPMAPEDLWQALLRTGEFERWWPWMRDLHIDGEWPREGATLSFAVVTPLPYRMRLEVSIERMQAPSRIWASVAGDLQGTASAAFVDAPHGARAELEWDVEVRQRPMRAAARVARPVLKWGHDWAVAVALQGFRRRLDVEAR